MDSFRKMQQLRRDCERVRNLLDLVRHREKIKLAALNVKEEMFDQQMHDLVNPGSARAPKHDVSGRVSCLASGAFVASVTSYRSGNAIVSPLLQLEKLQQQLSIPRLSGLESDRPAKRMKRAKKHRKRSHIHLDGDMELDDDDEDDDGTMGYGDRERDGVPGLRDGMDESMAEKSRQKSIRAAIPSFMESFPGRSSYILSSVFVPSVQTFTKDTPVPPFVTEPEPERSRSISYSWCVIHPELPMSTEFACLGPNRSQHWRCLFGCILLLQPGQDWPGGAHHFRPHWEQKAPVVKPTHHFAERSRA